MEESCGGGIRALASVHRTKLDRRRQCEGAVQNSEPRLKQPFPASGPWPVAGGETQLT